MRRLMLILTIVAGALALVAPPVSAQVIIQNPCANVTPSPDEEGTCWIYDEIEQVYVATGLCCPDGTVQSCLACDCALTSACECGTFPLACEPFIVPEPTLDPGELGHRTCGDGVACKPAPEDFGLNFPALFTEFVLVGMMPIPPRNQFQEVRSYEANFMGNSCNGTDQFTSILSTKKADLPTAYATVSAGENEIVEESFVDECAETGLAIHVMENGVLKTLVAIKVNEIENQRTAKLQRTFRIKFAVLANAIGPNPGGGH